MALATYTVKRGDNLTKICDGRCGAEVAASIAGNTVEAKINTLVSLNNLKNRNLIITGQVLKLSASGGQSSSSSSSKSSTSTDNSRKVNTNDIRIGLLSADNTTSKNRAVYADWSYDGRHKQNTASYKFRWKQYLSNGQWVSVEDGNTTSHEDIYCYDTCTAAGDAITIGFQVIPVSKTYTDKSGKEQYYFTEGSSENTSNNVALWSDWVYYNFSDNPPLTPEKPDVRIDNDTLTLTASISNIDPSELDANSVVFNVVRDNSTSIIISDPVLINTVANYVAWQCTVESGYTYTVRAKSRNDKGKESGWSDFSESSGTKPFAPIILTDNCRRVKRSDGSIAAHLEWEAINTAETYVIEYVTNDASDFENLDEIPSKETTDARTSIDMVLSDSELGYNYYFRVRAKNSDGVSEPSGIVLISIGSTPIAPITWSTSDSAFVGDTMELHWSHNPTDNSKQSEAELSLNINDSGWFTVGNFVNTTDANDEDERADEVSYDYGKSVSYKGDLYFKMDTSVSTLRDAKIMWRARTKGITDDFGAWSADSTIHIYDKPTLALSMTNDASGTGSLITTLTAFPFYVRAKDTLINHDIQKPIGYHVQVMAGQYYTTVDDIGRMKTVNAGDIVYSNYFSTAEELVVELSANNIDLESSISYTLYCMEDLSSGLTITNKHDFTVEWFDAEYPISANVTVNTDAYTALITPYCAEKVPAGPGGKNLFNIRATVDGAIGYGTVSSYDVKVIDESTLTFEYDPDHANYFPFAYWLDVEPNTYYTISIGKRASITAIYGYQDELWNREAQIFNKVVSASGTCSFNSGDNTRILIGFYSTGVNRDPTVTEETVTNIQIEVGYMATDYEPYYEKYVDGNLIDNLTLSVYRREYDGSFTEVASGIPNNYTSVTDPHPALDRARYRFVAKDMLTGAISFYDMPGQQVNCSSIILQWAEDWSTFDTGEDQTIEGISWSGSLLKLPYNIKVTDTRKPEVALVEYAGRKHPVSYYGTQVGETTQWSADIPKDDKETIYALRRLSLWAGDVYVREPSGMGYWANVEVSFNQSYDAVTVPISLNITRVEGGV